MSIDRNSTHDPLYPWSNKEHFIVKNVSVHHKEMQLIKNIHMNNDHVFKFIFTEYCSDDQTHDEIIDLSFQY